MRFWSKRWRRRGGDFPKRRHDGGETDPLNREERERAERLLNTSAESLGGDTNLQTLVYGISCDEYPDTVDRLRAKRPKLGELRGTSKMEVNEG